MLPKASLTKSTLLVFQKTVHVFAELTIYDLFKNLHMRGKRLMSEIWFNWEILFLINRNYGVIHKGYPHIMWGRGVRQKGTNVDRGRGRGWLAKCGRPLGKKIIATIFVKFTHNLAVCLYIMSCLCVMPCYAYVMPVCHIYFAVNPIFWNAIV